MKETKNNAWVTQVNAKKAVVVACICATIVLFILGCKLKGWW